MKILQGIQSSANQTLRTTAENGDIIEIILMFKPAVKMWFANITCNECSVNGLRVCNSPNLLQQFNKLIPFGINIGIEDGSEPFLINDFSSGRVVLSILTPEEVLQINAAYREAKI